MNSIKIGAEERPLSEADSQWITQQINGRRRDGQAVCVVVTIRTADVDIRLATPACGGGGGGRRRPNDRENAILELWRHFELDDGGFSPGNLVAFVKQVLQRL